MTKEKFSGIFNEKNNFEIGIGEITVAD